MFDLSQIQLEGFPSIKQVEMTYFVKNRIGKGSGGDEARDEKKQGKKCLEKVPLEGGVGGSNP